MILIFSSGFWFFQVSFASYLGFNQVSFEMFNSCVLRLGEHRWELFQLAPTIHGRVNRCLWEA